MLRVRTARIETKSSREMVAKGLFASGTRCRLRTYVRTWCMSCVLDFVFFSTRILFGDGAVNSAGVGSSV